MLLLGQGNVHRGINT